MYLPPILCLREVFLELRYVSGEFRELYSSGGLPISSMSLVCGPVVNGSGSS